MGSEPVGSHDFLNLRYSAISLEKKSQKALSCSWPGPYAAPTHIGTLRVNAIGNVKSGQKKPFVARTIHVNKKYENFNETYIVQLNSKRSPANLRYFSLHSVGGR